jgi:hypothetical protein
MCGQLFQTRYFFRSNEFFIPIMHCYTLKIPGVLLLTPRRADIDLRLQNSMSLLLTTHAFSNLATEIFQNSYC